MVNNIAITDERWQEMAEEIITQHFEQGRYITQPVLESIFNNIQTICEVYTQFPDTCVVLLQQVVADFDADDYEKNVLTPIQELACIEPAVAFVHDSLLFIRRFFGDNPTFLTETFHHQIAAITSKPNETKLQTFSEICKNLCISAVNKTVNEINLSATPRPSHALAQ